MIRINLLPHRELRRQAAQRRFAWLAGLTLTGVVFVAVAVHLVLATLISNQDTRNQYLTDEVQKLDQQIARIHSLKDKKQALLARQQVIVTLERNRTLAVRLLDQMARLVPAGVTLKSLHQQDDMITLEGYADSNDRVAAFMNNLEASPLLSAPTLLETRTAQPGSTLIAFDLNVKLRGASADPLSPGANTP